MKKCPFCAEEIQNEARKCKHCGEYLDSPSARDAIVPGTVLGNHRIQEKIGSGGMGDVYLAEHLELKSKAAIKILP